ncbi:hypothetical protein PABY_06330 [Pyrodictium abyssi]|uniref:Rad50/SbcC-type AAA domain-containing protein n=1 Tax=Pyrodictium abyssi TaxID=54256 RepID=A0ABM8IW59_9CREN|nr:hypothetical protein PABY_06330 [Pyrodictium abyssi]
MTHIEEVKAYLPYISEGELEGLEVDVNGLQRFTIIVGRNASGKTSLLEALGYTVALTGHGESIAPALAMIRTMRQQTAIPSFLAGLVRESEESGNGEDYGIERVSDTG